MSPPSANAIRPAVDHEVGAVDGDLPRVAAVGRVVLQQVRERRHAGDVVHADDVDVVVAGGPRDQAADPAEPVHGDPYGHLCYSRLSLVDGCD